jgi:guanylate kinase
MNSGKLIILSAPSGSGKTTLVKYLMEQRNDLIFSVSATSRPRREHEIHGVDYFFLTEEEFREKIEVNAFLEWEEVYPGRFYGTLTDQVDHALDKGIHLVFDVDVVGGLNIKKHYGDNALALFIMAPSAEVMAQRLRNRATDTEESIKSRMEKATWEMQFSGEFDAIILNDNLDEAKKSLMALVNSFLQHN